VSAIGFRKQSQQESGKRELNSMKTKQIVATGTAVMLMALGTVAPAQDTGQEIVATLEKTEGTVLVNRGEAFIVGQRNIPLYSNNRILTRSASKALVKYPDGCELEVPERSLLTVKNAEECTKGAALLSDSGTLGADPATAGAAAGGATAGAVGAGTASGGVGLGTIGAGVAGTLGLAGAVILANDNNNDNDDNQAQISPAD
jgi:hypothetical protein